MEFLELGANVIFHGNNSIGDLEQRIKERSSSQNFKIIKANFTNLNQILDYSNLNIDELVLSERFAWQLTLNDGVRLDLGRENRVERIQRFMDAYPKIKVSKNKNQQVDYIDLRYDTGLAVGWKSVDT